MATDSSDNPGSDRQAVRLAEIDQPKSFSRKARIHARLNRSTEQTGCHESPNRTVTLAVDKVRRTIRQETGPKAIKLLETIM